MTNLKPRALSAGMAEAITEARQGRGTSLKEPKTRISDVAALIAELNEWAGSYEEGSFDTEEDLMRRAASELARLATERDEHLRGKNDLVAKAYKAMDDLDAAKAEIARLTEENAELKEFDLTKPDAEWREIYDDQLKRTEFFSGQLSEAEDEIEWLQDAVDELLVEIQGMREAALKPDTGE